MGSALLAVAAGVAFVMAILAVVAWRHLEAHTGAFLQALLDADLGTDDTPQQIRYSLGYNLASAAGTALVAAVLAVAVRRPLPWAPVATWCLTAVAWLALGCGVSAGPEIIGPKNVTLPAIRRVSAALMPSWYPSVNTVLVVAVLAALTATAVLLARDTSRTYFRAPGRREDPRYAAFLARQSRSAADEVTPSA